MHLYNKWYIITRTKQKEGLHMRHNVRTVNQLRTFINSINNLSADLICSEAIATHSRRQFEQFIEESLIEHDREKFEKYTKLLKELDNND